MTASQTLKSGRMSAVKDVEKARKAHAKLVARAESFNKEFAASKTALGDAERDLKAIDDALKNMGETTKTAAPVKAAPATKTAESVASRRTTSSSCRRQPSA